MSQSSQVSKIFGAMKLQVDKRVETGSTSEITPTIIPAPTSLADAAATITVAQLKTGLFTITPTTGRALTLPTAALMKGLLPSVGSSISFSVINLGADTNHVTVQNGTGGSVVGSGVVRDSSETTDADSGSARFLIRMTNVTASSEAYVCYRIA
jgi:hypothetical protein